MIGGHILGFLFLWCSHGVCAWLSVSGESDSHVSFSIPHVSDSAETDTQTSLPTPRTSDSPETDNLGAKSVARVSDSAETDARNIRSNPYVSESGETDSHPPISIHCVSDSPETDTHARRSLLNHWNSRKPHGEIARKTLRSPHSPQGKPYGKSRTPPHRKKNIAQNTQQTHTEELNRRKSYGKTTKALPTQKT